MPYYEDKPSVCCGTHPNASCWCNSSDCNGLIFATVVWVFILFAAAVTLVVVIDTELELYNGIVILFLIFMALWSHLKTTLSDPGVVPPNAHPLPHTGNGHPAPLTMCGRCDGYRPPGCHHDRVSNRCISRMDHFCPWMNNAIGAKNQKNFFLFLIYTNLASCYMYAILALHLVDCGEFTCFTGVGLQLVRVLIFVLLFGIIFTTSMILNQVYGLSVGLGTIDRMKLKKDDPEMGTPVPFTQVFGVSWPTYFLPLDPVWENEEEVFHYRLADELFSSDKL